MKERDLGESVEQKRFFETVDVPSTEQDEGTRDMTPLLPFVVSGGQIPNGIISFISVI